ncbi:MAG: HD domain-containing protein [Anaerolineales bacterium]|jgi:uncharacterized protein|nr:HD domain-containing protein [Anaerolineales bacterium]
MTQAEIIAQTEAYVRETLAAGGAGHDWWHVYRVWKNALHIAQTEPVDLFVVELAALLHDIADHKFHGGDERIGPETARAWLEKLNVAENVSAHVTEIIATLSFKGANVPSPMRTAEGRVVQDADRLDAIGAIGIARAFAYGGSKGRLLHDPNLPLEFHESFESYKNSPAPTINHFYEKLLLLKDLMNTETARKIAVGRHQYMQDFLKQFHAEWEGQDYQP